MHPFRPTDETFCIAVFGDFLGEEASVGLTADERWEPRRATPETVSELLGLRPAVHLDIPGAGQALRMEFRTLDDFGPDSLFGRFDAFRDLREARRALKEGEPLPPGLTGGEGPGPESGPEEVAGGGPGPGERNDQAAGPEDDADRGSGSGTRGGLETDSAGARTGSTGPDLPEGADLLDAILEGREEENRATDPEEITDPERASDPGRRTGQGPDPERPPGQGPDPGLRRFVREIVRPHLVSPDTDREEAIAGVDRSASEVMERVLHAPGFLELEAAWRSLVFLLSRIDTSGKTRVYLVPVTRSDLADDLLSTDDPEGSRLFDLLSRPPLGAPERRWALALGAYELGAEPGDVDLLRRIGGAARLARVPWISGLAPETMGQDSFAGSQDGRDWPDSEPGEWRSLRASPGASWVALAAPRFLVREPYGEEGRPVRAFDFQESVNSRADLPWGNGAFVCGALLGQGHARAGWSFRPSDFLEMDGLPLAPGGVPGGSPPSSLEGDFSAGAARILANRGFVPLVSFPRQARIRVGGLRSLSADGSPLRGRWEAGA